MGRTEGERERGKRKQNICSILEVFLEGNSGGCEEWRASTGVREWIKTD